MDNTIVVHYYQIQTKAIARRFDLFKYMLAFIKYLFAVGVIIGPIFIDGIGTIAVTVAGYLAYLGVQLAEWSENHELRNKIEQTQTDIKSYLEVLLMKDIDSQFKAQIENYLNSDVLPANIPPLFAKNWSRDEEDYRLFHPSPHRLICQPGMFGASVFNVSTLVWFIHFGLATTAFITAIIAQIKKPPDDSATDSLPLTAIITGIFAAIIAPIPQHFTKANLIRYLEVWEDIQLAFWRPISIVVDSAENDKECQIENIQNYAPEGWVCHCIFECIEMFCNFLRRTIEDCFCLWTRLVCCFYCNENIEDNILDNIVDCCKEFFKFIKCCQPPDPHERLTLGIDPHRYRFFQYYGNNTSCPPCITNNIARFDSKTPRHIVDIVQTGHPASGGVLDPLISESDDLGYENFEPELKCTIL